ncbi:MAG: response regulator transcription factor [Flavobacteriales bacterium]|nr:response regulator transcription factor [Flavobacteriales bacterium]
MRAYTIALVDDHPVVLAGLERLLLRHGTYQVVVSATSGESLMEQMQRSGPVDLAIVDLRMPGMDGFAVIAWLKANYPATRSVALSFSDELQWVRRALHAGARGYLLKDMAPDAITLRCTKSLNTGNRARTSSCVVCLNRRVRIRFWSVMCCTEYPHGNSGSPAICSTRQTIPICGSRTPWV